MLCAPGFWRPHLVAPGSFDRRATYESLEALPHSYSALLASGCCDEGASGLFALYLVLANEADQDRPRMKVAGWPHKLDWDPRKVARLLQGNPEGLKNLRAVQEVLRKHGNDLVALGHLRP